jgi:hypothetical protein
MGFWQKIKENQFEIILDIIIFILIGIVHFVLYFYYKQSDFDNIFDVYESSPLFGLKVQKEDCGSQTPYTFQVWEGMKEEDGRYKTKIVDRTNLNKLHGYFFVIIINHIKIYYIMAK